MAESSDPFVRRLIVLRFEDGSRKIHFAAAMDVSRKCVRTRAGQYLAEGNARPRGRSCRSLVMPNRTADEAEQNVLTARAEDRQGPDILGRHSGGAPAGVRVLQNHCSAAACHQPEARAQLGRVSQLA